MIYSPITILGGFALVGALVAVCSKEELLKLNTRTNCEDKRRGGVQFPPPPSVWTFSLFSSMAIIL